MNLSVSNETLYPGELAKLKGYKFDGSFLAGGAVTSVFSDKPINDYDLYFKNKESFEKAVKEAYEDGFWCVSVSSRAITFSDSGTIVQFMHFKWFPTVASIFESFDFTICMGAVDFDANDGKGQLILHPRFLIDLASHKLVFNHGTDYPSASGLRILKFQDREFTISRRELAKLLVAVQFQPAKSWEELKDQLGGSYGDPVAMASDKPYTLDNVIEALDNAYLPPDGKAGVDDKASHTNTQKSLNNRDVPNNAKDAIEKCYSFRS